MSRQLNRWRTGPLTVGAVLAACGLAQAQYSTTFEAPTYTSSLGQGTLLTNGAGGGGQDGWYLPTVGGRDGYVMTFAGNTWNVAAHPTPGNLQCQVNSPSAPLFGRSQHAIAFGAGGVWEATWDNYGRYNGTLPAADNLGSWSLQNSASARYFQQLMTWGATTVGPAPNATNYTATADKYHIAYGYFAGTDTNIPGAIIFETPGAAWRDIPVDHWVRCTVKWTFDIPPRILKCTIQDMTAGGPVNTAYISTCHMYLQGGANSAAPIPTDFRLFAGGGGAGTETLGNVTAWDNISIVASSVGSGACCLPAGGCDFLNQVACCAAGGTYRGDGVACAGANCPPPGACCKPDGTCVSTVQTSCAALSGIYRGDNTVCGNPPCVQFGYAEGANDAGPLPASAAQINGTGQALTLITGGFDLDDTDMYHFKICNEGSFSATTVGGTGLDTMLWLFSSDGRGVVMDDDTSGSNPQSTITSQFVTANGNYYLAITLFENAAPAHGRVAHDASSNPIWNPTNPGGAVFPEWAPNGPGAANPVAAWSGATNTTGQYAITLAGSCFLGGSSCYANCDGSTGTPLLTANDFQCFANAYAAGCT